MGAARCGSAGCGRWLGLGKGARSGVVLLGVGLPGVGLLGVGLLGVDQLLVWRLGGLVEEWPVVLPRFGSED